MESSIKGAIGIALSIIGVLIGLYIVPSVFIALFPLAVAQIVSMATLANFTFAGLFTGSGLFVLTLSLLGLLSVLGIIVGGVLYAVKSFKGVR